MKIKIGIGLHLLFVLVILLSSQTISPVHAQGRDLFVPTVTETETVIEPQVGNNAYFVTSNDAAVVDHDIVSEDQDFVIYSTMETSRSFLSNVAADTDYPINDLERLYQAVNGSTDNLQLTSKVRYYDLTGGQSGKDVLVNTVLFAGTPSGFRFNTVNGPMVISFNLRGVGTFDLDILLMSPDGELWDYSDHFSNTFSTRINVQIPFIPPSVGQYTLFLSPDTSDIILQSFNIITSPEIIDITNGYSEKLEGTNSLTKFFKLQLDNEDPFGTVLDLESSILQYTNPEIATPMEDLIGEANIVVHAEFINPFISFDFYNPFGVALPAQIFVSNHTDVYFSVSVIAPNDNDPVVDSTKKHFNIPEGFDVDYAFWLEQFTIEELEPNVDFELNDDDPNIPENVFNLIVNEENQLFGLNSTGNSFAFVFNKTDPMSGYVLDSTSNDILNIHTHDIGLIEPGEYWVVLIDDVSDGDVRLSVFDPISNFDQGDTTTFFPKLDHPVFFMLDRDYPGKEYFDMTYLDDINDNIVMEFALFDDNGDNQLNSNPTFSLVSDNHDLGNTNLDEMYSMHGGFFRMERTGGTFDVDEKPSIQIQRIEYVDDQAQSSTFDFMVSDLLTFETREIEDATNNAAYIFEYSTDSFPSGYQIKTTSMNSSYQILVFVDWDIPWFDHTVSDNEDLIKFGTYESIDIIVVVLVSSTGINSELTISLQKAPVTELPPLDLGTLNTVSYDAFEEIISSLGDPDGDDSIFNDPLLYGGAFAVVAVVAGTGYFLWNRRV